MTPRKTQHHLYPTYEKTKQLILNHGIHSVLEYRKFYYTCPKKIPYHPERIYANNWLGWDIFLSKQKTPMASFEEAKRLVHIEDIQTILEYENWYKECEQRLPSSPPQIYKEHWKSWSDFLRDKPKFASYEAASAATIAAGIKTHTEYTKWYRRSPVRIPSAPQIKYAEWTSWNEFLGKI